MTTVQAMAWAKTPYVKKLEEPKREELHCEALEALRLEVLRLTMANGAYGEALEAYRKARV